MSAVADQQARYSEGRTRLGFPVTPEVRVKRRVVPQVVVDKIEPTPVAVLSDPVVETMRPRRPERQLHWSRILAEVSQKHGIDEGSLISSGRFMHIVLARNEAMWRMRHEITVGGKPLSLPQIARRFGKDHSTVLHSVRCHQKLLDQLQAAASDFPTINTTPQQGEEKTLVSGLTP